MPEGYSKLSFKDDDGRLRTRLKEQSDAAGMKFGAFIAQVLILGLAAWQAKNQEAAVGD